MRINLKSEIVNDKYTEYIYSKYDIQDRKESIVTINHNLDSAINGFDWNIGVIYGNSGSGKTSILNQLGQIKKYNYSEDKPLISNFEHLAEEEACKVLTSIGLSSIPTWLRPYKVLSNGERYRADMAMSISKSNDEIILIDEYTSVVDRSVAKAMSYSLQKYIRRENKKIILASCHSDILDWALPDWVCCPEKGGRLEKVEYLRRGRKQIELQVSRTESDTWDFFKKHHYLTEDFNKASSCFLFLLENIPVGFVAVLPQPSGTMNNAVRGSRTVVIPDYQGLGIGKSISDFIGGIYRHKGYRYFAKTVNPALGEYRNKSSKWKQSSKYGKLLNPIYAINEAMNKNSKIRKSYCHEYIGEKINGYDELLLPIGQMRNNKMNEKQFILF